MCGRTTSELSRDELARLLDVDEVDAPELPLSWNIAPTRQVYAVAAGPTGTRVLTALRWGLVPAWSKGPASGAPMVNARAETVATKPAFREALLSRRVLVPVSGFYEWHRHGPGRREPAEPWYFRRADGEPLVFAALAETWYDGEGRPLRSCAVITTGPNAVMAPVHDRMPVVLRRRDWDEWLAPRPLAPARLAQLLVPPPDHLLEAVRVSRAVNNTANDSADLVLAARAETSPAGASDATGPEPEQLSLLAQGS